MASEENREIVRRQEEALNAGRPDAGLNLFADDWLYHGQRVGPQGVAQARAPFWAAMPDVFWTLEQVIAEGDRVATRWTVRGTHTADFVHPVLGRAPASGRSIQYAHVVHHRIADGKVAESWDVSDRLTLLQQLGVIPMPTSVDVNQSIIRRWYEEVWNQNNLDLLDELYAPTWVGHFPQGLELRGPAGHKQFGKVFSVAFPDAHYDIEEVRGEGDLVTCRYAVRATHRGELRGLPPTGKEVASTGINIH